MIEGGDDKILIVWRGREVRLSRKCVPRVTWNGLRYLALIGWLEGTKEPRYKHCEMGRSTIDTWNYHQESYKALFDRAEREWC
jgi:hypothetical protein